MPTRLIRDGILTSERVNRLTERAELFYRRLMSVADDHGRFYANLTLLRASCYPLKLDSVKEDSIKKHLAEAEDAGLIVLYTVAGTAYLQMLDFGQRVQAKSKFPDPPELSTAVHRVPPCSTVENRLVVDVDVCEDGNKPIERQAARFAEFWSVYPNRKGKAEAEKKWKARKLDAIADQIIADVRSRITNDRDWLRGFIPHGSTYVNAEGWKDGMPPADVPAKNGKPEPVCNPMGPSPQRPETAADRDAAKAAFEASLREFGVAP